MKLLLIKIIIKNKIKKFLKKINEKINDKIKEPIIPEYVLFGLIFVNFFPLKILPNIYPPISEEIQTYYIIIKIKIIFFLLFTKK